MKVLDIITETTPAPATPAFSEADVIANWLKNNPHLEVKEKYDPRASNFATRWISKNKYANAEIMEAFAARYGIAFTFLKAIGIIGPMVLCVMHLRALNELAKQTDSDGKPVHDLDYIKRQENAIVGTFLASQIADIVIRSVQGGVFVSSLSQLATAMAMRTPGGARAVIVAMLAKEAGLIALKMWINSPAGLKWCTEGVVMPLIVGGLGALGNTFLEFLRDKIKEYTGKDIGIVTPDINKRKDKEEPAKYTGPSSDAIAQHEKEVEKRTNPILAVPR